MNLSDTKSLEVRMAYWYSFQEDKEKKRQEQLERKKELQKLHDEEMAAIKKAGPVPQAKVTKAEIDKHIERERKEKEGADHVVKVTNFFRGHFVCLYLYAQLVLDISFFCCHAFIYFVYTSSLCFLIHKRLIFMVQYEY